MGWAATYILALMRGEAVQFRPRGRSMEPRIKSGHLCTVVPVLAADVRIDDIVLCHVGGAEYLHLVKAVDSAKGKFLIGNNGGHINGWTATIYGRCTKIEP
jgi:hypothetical protein